MFYYAALKFLTWVSGEGIKLVSDYYRGGGESPRSNHYFKAKPKLSVFENGQFSGHFFLDQKFKKKCQMLWGKKFWNFFWHSKKFFFKTLFFKKQFKKNLENFLRAKSFSKLFFTFFQKKCPEKKFFLSVKKISKLFPHNILHFF